MLKSSLDRQTKVLTIDNTEPGIQFEMPLTQDSFAVNGVPLLVCRASEMAILGILERSLESIQSEFLGVRSFLFQMYSTQTHRITHITILDKVHTGVSMTHLFPKSPSLVYSIDGACVEKLVDFVLN